VPGCATVTASRARDHKSQSIDEPPTILSLNCDEAITVETKAQTVLFDGCDKKT
jgi:hypothetical protein